MEAFISRLNEVFPAYAGVIYSSLCFQALFLGLSRVCGVINISFPGNASDNHGF